jgi:DNA-nicking Smr family endonuclease
VSSEEDSRAFAEAMRGVKPIKRRNTVASSTRPEPKARLSRAGRKALLEESLGGPSEAMEQMGDEIAFRRPGVSQQIFRQLRRGRFRVEDEIDLHGLSVTEARTALRDFITGSVERGLGCVRVVHGKGLRSGPAGPVLKHNVQTWLARWDEVLAFVSARIHDGGSGAVYVLLRRR